MPVGTEVGLGPGHTVVDGDPAAIPKKEAHPPNFRPVEPAALHAAAKNIIYFTALAVLRGRPHTAAAVDR